MSKPLKAQLILILGMVGYLLFGSDTDEEITLNFNEVAADNFFVQARLVWMVTYMYIRIFTCLLMNRLALVLFCYLLCSCLHILDPHFFVPMLQCVVYILLQVDLLITLASNYFSDCCIELLFLIRSILSLSTLIVSLQ